MGAADRSATRRASLLVALLFIVSTFVACDGQMARVETPFVVERDTSGDTIVVRTVSGSAWGDGVRLEEELRIGAREGDDEYAFGRVTLMAAGPDGTLVTRHGYLRFDAAGQPGDTLPLPDWPDLPPPLAPFAPRGLTAPHPRGGIVSARSDRYAIDLPRQDGGLLRVERDGQVAVVLHPEERTERQAMLDDLAQRAPGAQRIVVPDTKPFLRELHMDPEGRLWVKPHVEAVETETTARGPMSTPMSTDRWQEPETWDVFDIDGAYLGRLTLPRRATLHSMRSDRVWGTVLDEDDVPSVVRWRIVDTR